MTADEVAERLVTPAELAELAELLAELETSDDSSSWGLTPAVAA